MSKVSEKSIFHENISIKKRTKALFQTAVSADSKNRISLTISGRIVDLSGVRILFTALKSRSLGANATGVAKERNETLDKTRYEQTYFGQSTATTYGFFNAFRTIF